VNNDPIQNHVDLMSPKWRGFLIALVSLCLGVIGFGLAAAGAEGLGKVVLVLGIIGVFVGLVLHLIIMAELFLRSFRSDSENEP
jgi:hypothetical protein